MLRFSRLGARCDGEGVIVCAECEPVRSVRQWMRRETASAGSPTSMIAGAQAADAYATARDYGEDLDSVVSPWNAHQVVLLNQTPRALS